MRVSLSLGATAVSASVLRRDDHHHCHRHQQQQQKQTRLGFSPYTTRVSATSLYAEKNPMAQFIFSHLSRLRAVKDNDALVCLVGVTRGKAEISIGQRWEESGAQDESYRGY